MAWTADSKAVIFHSNRNGSMGIFKQSLDEETPEAIVTVQEDSAPAASVLSPDGLSLIYNLLPKGQGGTSSEPSRIMRVPVSGGVPQLVMTTPLSGPPRCARLPATLCATAERASDGKQLTFTALDPIKGGGRELTRFGTDPGTNYSWDLSPDGTRIAVAKQEGKRFDILFLNGHAAQSMVVKGWDIGVDLRVATGKGEGVDLALQRTEKDCLPLAERHKSQYCCTSIYTVMLTSYASRKAACLPRPGAAFRGHGACPRRTDAIWRC